MITAGGFPRLPPLIAEGVGVVDARSGDFTMKVHRTAVMFWGGTRRDALGEDLHFAHIAC